MMSRIKKIFFSILIISLWSCQEDIAINTGDIESSVVIDAFIDNRPSTQIINITRSRRFNDLSDFERVSVDTVFIEDITEPANDPYVFEAIEEGVYGWEPQSTIDSFGIVGHEYKLTVVIENTSYSAISQLNPVPKIDSIKFNYIEESNFQEEGYEAEFFARDLDGLGNTYWIKGFKNGIFLNQPEYITTSFDGAFTESDEDSILFIPPLRIAINPFEDIDEENGIDPSYWIGDEVTVELHGITNDAFIYLNEIRTQTDRQGGISELFSVPTTNLTGNIKTSDGNLALGFFSISSVDIDSLILTEELAEKARDEAN